MQRRADEGNASTIQLDQAVRLGATVGRDQHALEKVFPAATAPTHTKGDRCVRSCLAKAPTAEGETKTETNDFSMEEQAGRPCADDVVKMGQDG